MISPLPAMFTSHLIGSIEPPDFTALVRPAIFPPIGLPVFAAILLSIGPSIFPAIVLPHIARLPHTNIISTASATVPT
jgi:hypothetical protein